MIETSNIKNLIFDFGGVLVDLDKERCFRAFEKINIYARDYLGQYVQNGVFRGIETGQYTTPEFCNEMRKMSGRNDLDDFTICDAWNKFLVGVPTERLDCLIELKKKFHLFLLSNTNEIHWNLSINNFFLYRGLTVDDYFEKIFLSFKLGLEKPDKKIFLHAIEEAKINPEESLFIDDSEENCAAAQSVGLHTLHSLGKGDWMNQI